MAKSTVEFEEPYVDFTSQVTVNSKIASNLNAFKSFIAKGNMCIAEGMWATTSGQSISVSEAIFTVPEKYRPKSTVNGCGVVKHSTDGDGLPGYYQLTTTGGIYASGYSGTTRGSFSFVWFTS